MRYDNVKYEIASYGLTGITVATVLAPVLLLTELAISAIFLFHLFGTTKLIVVMIVLAGFVLAQSAKKILRKEEECRCFGQKSMLNKYPLLRNAALIVFALASYCYQSVIQVSDSGAASVQIMMFTVMMLIVLAVDIRSRRKSLEAIAK